MRTTLTIDDDVLDRARTVAGRLRMPFRRVVTEAIRCGLSTVEQPAVRNSYRTQPSKMGLRSVRNLDSIGEVLAQIEGEDHR